MAIHLGPAGVAIIGQFNNFYSIITALSNGSITQGIVKYSAEFHDNEAKQKAVISTSFYISITASLVIMIVLMLVPGQWSQLVMKSREYVNIFFLAGLTISLVSVNLLLQSVLNGLRRTIQYVGINLAGNILLLVLSILFIRSFNLYGAFLAIILAQSLVVLISWTVARYVPYLSVKNLFGAFDKKIAKQLFSFSLVAITTVIVSSSVQMIIRNHLGTHLSWQDAGYWQGVWTISDVYLLFISSILSIYYFPLVSATQDKTVLKQEVIKTFKILVPVCALFAAMIFLLREFLITLLFTSEFMQMKPLFAFQLLGDVLKIASWILNYIFLAKAMIRISIMFEIFTGIFFVTSSIFLINTFGLIGASYAFFLSYLIYFCFNLFYALKYFRNE